MLANVCNAFIFVAAVWRWADRMLSLVWATLIACYAFFYGIRVRRKRLKPQSVSPRSIQRVIRNALMLGCLWAALPLFFFIGASARRTIDHHLSLRGHAGRRGFCVCECADCSDRVYKTHFHLHCLGNCHRAKWVTQAYFLCGDAYGHLYVCSNPWSVRSCLSAHETVG